MNDGKEVMKDAVSDGLDFVKSITKKHDDRDKSFC